MARMRLAMAGLILGGFLMVASPAGAVTGAVTLGTTTIPTGGSATGSDCAAGLFIQDTSDPAYVYTIPAGGGAITSWSTNTSDAVAGTHLSLVILQPSGSSYTVVTADAEVLPSTLPAGGVTTFNLTTPIPVATGDLLGLWSASTFGCLIEGGGLTANDKAIGDQSVPAPTTGTTYSDFALMGEESVLNVSANLEQDDDVGVTGGAAPPSITAGGAADLAFSVTSNGPVGSPVTFTDTVPSGLQVLSAVAGSGACSTAGQTVTCTIGALATGSTAPVSIVVVAPTAGAYTDAATVSTSLADPNSANNSASLTLAVTPATPATVATAPSCRTVSLAGAPLAVAKAVLPDVNCTVGKTTKKTSKSVRKGYVISTSPGGGKTLAYGTKVNIVVSSGPPPKKKKKKKKKKK